MLLHTSYLFFITRFCYFKTGCERFFDAFDWLVIGMDNYNSIHWKKKLAGCLIHILVFKDGMKNNMAVLWLDERVWKLNGLWIVYNFFINSFNFFWHIFECIKNCFCKIVLCIFIIILFFFNCKQLWVKTQ